jgi:hypothetical protein
MQVSVLTSRPGRFNAGNWVKVKKCKKHACESHEGIWGGGAWERRSCSSSCSSFRCCKEVRGWDSDVKTPLNTQLAGWAPESLYTTQYAVSWMGPRVALHHWIRTSLDGPQSRFTPLNTQSSGCAPVALHHWIRTLLGGSQSRARYVKGKYFLSLLDIKQRFPSCPCRLCYPSSS